MLGRAAAAQQVQKHRRGSRPRCVSGLGIIAAVVLVAFVAAPAQAERFHVFETSFAKGGSGAGEMHLRAAEEEVAGSEVAVNSTTHDVYVADTENHRVDEFEADGTFVRAWGWGVVVNGLGFENCTPTSLGGCKEGISGTEPGEFEAPALIAVDNSGGPSEGDVYVGDTSDNVITKFTETGTLIKSWGVEGQLNGSTATGPIAGPFSEIAGITVDASGNLDVLQKSANALFEFEQGGGFVDDFEATEHGSRPAGLAVNTEGDLFKVRGVGVVDEFEGPSGLHPGEEIGQVTAGEEGSSSGLAFDASSRTLYVDAGGDVQRFAFVGARSVSEPGGAACAVEPFYNGNEKAHFEGCMPAESFGSSEPAGGSLTAGAGVAADSSNGNVYVVEPATSRIDVFSLELPSHPAIKDESVSEVTSDSARFLAEVDPSGASTEVRAEYGPCGATPATCAGSSYPESTSAELVGSEFAFGAIAPLVAQGLGASTVYHFRLVAENEVSKREGRPVLGEEVTFTTRATGEFGLPDNRAWELTSPADKHGALIEPIGEAWVIQAAAKGGAITYVTDAPTESDPAGYDNFQQVLSTRGAGGWSSQNIALPHNSVTELSVGPGNEYRFFSEDLSLAVAQPFGPFTSCEGSEGESQPCLSPAASEQTAFLRDLVSGIYTPLVTGCPGKGESCGPPVEEHADVPAGTVFGQTSTDGHPCPTEVVCGPEFRGGTSDLAHVVLESYAPLKPQGNADALYEWSAGAPVSQQLQLVSMLPMSGGKEELALGPVLGGEVHEAVSKDVRHAISLNGSRVVWTSEGKIYLRDTNALSSGDPRAQTTILIGEGEFQTATSELSVVFYTDHEVLYAYDVEDEHSEQLAEGVEGTLPGASEDGAYVYYVSDKNLYVDHHEGAKWMQTFIAALSAGDKNDWDVNLPGLTARVSPNGQWLAFMSQHSLTGYDNLDAVSGNADEEVYLFDAARSVSENVPDIADNPLCASCDPTGARPHGIEYHQDGGSVENIPLAGGDDFWPPTTWLAANIPGWTPYRLQEAFYQSRYLSNSGRLFFNSADTLVPKDVNGREDVYEFEPAGVGSCASTVSTGSVVFDGAAGGCVGLISSGTSSEESAFLDASETGDEAFFLTTAKLTSQDTEGGLSVWDARVCEPENGNPCIESSQEEPPACETESECRPAPADQPAIYGPAGSATFSGFGNLASSSAAATKPAVVTETRAQKLAKALKHCRSDRKRTRRAKCERTARKKYGVREHLKAKKAHGDRTASR